VITTVEKFLVCVRDLVDEVHAVGPGGVPQAGEAELFGKSRLVGAVDRDP
jgi:hypothetical protein